MPSDPAQPGGHDRGAVLDAVPGPAMVLALDGEVRGVNTAFARVIGRRRSLVQGTPLWDLLYDGHDGARAALRGLSPDAPGRLSLSVRTPQGSRRLHMTARLVVPEDSAEAEVHAIAAEDTTGPAAVHVIDLVDDPSGSDPLAQTQFRTLASLLPVGVFVVDADRKALWGNDAWAAIMGRPVNHLLGHAWREVLDARDLRTLDEAVDGDGPEGEPVLRVRVRGGDADRWIQARFRVRFGVDGQRRGAVGVVEDVTDSVVLEARLAHDASHDALTGLPNRVMVFDRLEVALVRRKRTGRFIAVLFCDLDGFKLVNDLGGHRLGDEVLARFANRLSNLVRAHDTVARIGGDEFLVVCEDLRSRAEAAEIAHRLVRQGLIDVEVAGRTLTVHMSVGAAVAGPEDAEVSADELVRLGDAAMYAAKADADVRAVVVDVAEAGALEGGDDERTRRDDDPPPGTPSS